MIALASIALAALQQPSPTALVGMWDAWLDSPGGKLRFTLQVENEGELLANLINATEVAPIASIAWSEESVRLDFAPYESTIEATLTTSDAKLEEAARLDGTWRKRSGRDEWTELPFHATQPARNLYHDPSAFYGRWSMRFASSEELAVAELRQHEWWMRRNVTRKAPIGVAGTILTTLGDYRFLEGRAYDGSHIELSCFDGAHAFLFKGELKPNGILIEGDFWSGAKWHETWTATKDANAALPDPFGLTKVNATAKLDTLSFRGVDGVERSLGEWAGKPRIVQLFGSWCPNCNDEAEFLRELEERYRGQGLAILGLGFELTGDFERDAKFVKLYAERHRLSFPLFVAGTSDKAEASKRFPLLDKLRAYPTTLFVRRDGSVRAVHQGYSGPATGAEHARLRESFERLIDELIAEGETK